MKQKSIFTIFAAITMVLGFAMTGLGQISDNIDATANVLGALSVSKVTDLAFGNVALAGAKTIDLAGVASGPGSAGGIISKGCFKVDKTVGTNVDVTFTVLPSALDGTLPANTLPIDSYVASWTIAAGSGMAGTPVSTTVGTPTQTDDSHASIWVHIGGTVTPGGTTIVDTYTGIITLSAVYN